MKKKLFVATLLALVLPVVGINAGLQNSHNHNHFTETFAAYHEHDDGYSFTEWNSTNSLPDSGGWVLTHDVVLPSTWRPNHDSGNPVRICLHGHSITLAGTGPVISATYDVYIYECDHSVTHKYKINEETGLAVVDDSLTEDYETFTGGYITGGNGSNGGGVYMEGTSWTDFRLIGATIIGNKSTGNGGGINYAYVKKKNSSITLTNANIIGNVADGIGGGIYHGANNLYIELNGNNVIKENVSGSAPAGILEESAFNINAGQHYIYGNKLKSGEISDVKVNHSSQKDCAINVAGTLESGSKIGITNVKNNRINGFYSHNDTDPNSIFASETGQFFAKSGNNVVYNGLTVTGYYGKADGEPHSIDIALNDSDITNVVEYGIEKGTYTTTTPISYTDCGKHTVYFRLTAGLNSVEGSEAVLISENDKTELKGALDEVNVYYNSIKDTYTSVIAPSLKGVIDTATGVFDNLSATELEISQAITELSSSKDQAAKDVTTVAAIRKAIKDIGTVTLEKEDTIKAARNAYAALDADLKPEINNLNDLVTAEATLQGLKDQKAANEVKALIDDIGEVTATDECKEKIDAARTAFDSLSDDQQALVTNYAALTAAEKAYADQAAANAVIDLIDSIGEVTNTHECEAKISEAREAYDALTGSQKALVSNLSILKEAEKAYGDITATDGVKALIEDIGTVEYTPLCQGKIEAARTAYDALSEDQQALVTNYSSLTKAEKDYLDLGAAHDVDVLIEAIGEVEYSSESKGKIDVARNAYEALSADQKPLVTNLSVLESAEKTYADKGVAALVIEKIETIGEVNFTEESKGKIDDARAAYDALTEDQKPLVSNYQVLVAAETTYASLKNDHEKAAEVEALISGIGEVTLEKEPVIVGARAAYSELTEAQKALVSEEALNTLDQKEAELKALKDAAMAGAVKTLIGAIGEVEYTETSHSKIVAARTAYDSLTSEQKALVDNYEVLTGAETQYEALKLAGVNNVKNLIDGIGTVSYPDSGDQISAARAAYDALTSEQKPLVNNYKTLTDAEARYAELEEQSHRDTVESKATGVTIQTKDATPIPVNIDIKAIAKDDVSAAKDSEWYKQIQAKLSNNQVISKVFDVKLVKTVGELQTEVALSDIKEGLVIKISIAIPEGMDLTGLKILHIHSQADIEYIENFVIESNKLNFEVSKLSEFAFVTTKAAPAPSPASSGVPGWVIALIIVGGALVLACLAYALLFFAFNKWTRIDDKVARVVKLGKKGDKVKVLLMPFKVAYIEENQIFDKKVDIK